MVRSVSAICGNVTEELDRDLVKCEESVDSSSTSPADDVYLNGVDDHFSRKEELLTLLPRRQQRGEVTSENVLCGEQGTI